MECSIDVCEVRLCHNIVSALISLLSFCMADLFSGESEALKSTIISVWGLMCDLSFSNVSFT